MQRFLRALMKGWVHVPALLCCAALLGLLFGEAPTWAADGYERNYNQAMRLYRDSQYAAAITKFQAAFEIQPFPRLLFNIGQAHLKLGQAQQALSFFERFRELQKTLSKQELAELRDREQQAQALIDKSERQPEKAPPAAKDPPAPTDKVEAAPLLAAAPPPSVAKVVPPPSAAPVAPPPSDAKVVPRMAVRPAVVTPVARNPSGPQRWSTPRLAAIGTLGGLLVISLATSITLTALDGSITTDSCGSGIMTRTNCISDLVPGYATGYAISGLLAGGLVLALTLPAKKPAYKK